MASKSAEQVLNDMPSGEDLLMSLAQELDLDLNEPTKEPVKVEVEKKVEKKVEKPKVEEKKATPKRRGRPKKADSSPKKEATSTKKKETTKKVSAKNDKPISDDSGVSKGKVESKPTSEKEPEKKAKKGSSFNRNDIFSEWYGYKVNYMGKPMDKEGKFVTLEKKYNAKAQEKFRDKNGRMLLVIHKTKDGKVFKVQVMKQSPDGKCEEMPVATTMTNPHRMENRCRAYAQLLGVAYNRSEDIEVKVQEG